MSYNPTMDDPDWRRRKQNISQEQDLKRRKRSMSEENEEFEDQEEYEEDEPMDTKEEMNDIDRQIAHLKKQKAQLAKTQSGAPVGVGANIASALAAGAKQAAASQMNELMTSQLKKALVASGMITEEAANSVGMEIILKIAGPSAILYLAEKYPDVVPQANLVANASKMALSAGAAEVVAPLMMVAGPMLKQLAGGAMKVQKEIEQSAPDFEVKQEEE